MATYATYRHVELDRVGLGKRRDSRVLKPPGGGSSISFGEEDDLSHHIKAKSAPQQEAPKNDNQDQSPKAETNGTTTPPQSPKDNATATKENNPSPATNGVAVNGTVTNGTNGTSTSGSSTPSSSRLDTQSRLFGQEARQEMGSRRVRDHYRSNIFTGDEEKTVNTPKPVYRRMWTRRDPVTGVGVLCWDLHAPRFAPIKRKANPVGNETPEPKTPEAKTPDQPQPQSQQKQRVPPGGFSTKLW